MLFVIGLLFSTGADARLLLVVSQDDGLYEQFESGFEDGLGVRNNELVVKRADKLEQLVMDPFDVVVVAGVEAAKALQKHPPRNIQVLYTLMPRTSYTWLRDNGMLVGSPHVLYIDQPAFRFVRLVNTALPDAKRLGYLSGEVSVEHEDNIEKETNRLGMKLFSGRVDTEGKFNSVLKQVFSHSDVLLVLPDPYLYNRRAIQTVLLASFRHQKPVFAYSESFVKAGALAALYSSPYDIGRYSAELAGCLFGDCAKQEQGTYFPKYFSVSVNHIVARQMGLTVQKAESLEKALHEQEAGDNADQAAP